MMYLPAFYLPPRYLPSGAPGTASYLPDDARRHEVYTRPTIDGPDTLVAVIPPGQPAGAVITGEPSSTQWVHVRGFNRLNRIDPTQRVNLRPVAFDADGNLLLPVPNPPILLTLIPAAGGEIVARWSYDPRTPTSQATPPATFRVYVAEDADPFDFDAPAVSGISAAGRVFTAALGPFAHGTLVRVVVRAVGAPGIGREETNTAEATATADALAPDAPSGLSTEVEDD